MAAASFFDHAASGTDEEQAFPLVSSVEEFMALRDKIASKHPRGGAVCFIHALIRWADPSTRELGEQLLVLAMAEDELVKGGTYKGYALHRSNSDRLQHLSSCLYTARSYVRGTRPETNAYAIPDESACQVCFRLQDKHVGTLESGRYKVFVWSTGASSARPVTLTKNKNGVWKVKEFSSLVVGCNPPPSQDIADAADAL